jgi:hypothetical protein
VWLLPSTLKLLIRKSRVRGGAGWAVGFAACRGFAGEGFGLGAGSGVGLGLGRGVCLGVGRAVSVTGSGGTVETRARGEAAEAGDAGAALGGARTDLDAVDVDSRGWSGRLRA